METDYIRKSLEVKGFLNELLQNKESREVEFKSAKGGFPGSFWETYSSFANTEGGVIIFGIKEKTGYFPLTHYLRILSMTLKRNFQISNMIGKRSAPPY